MNNIDIGPSANAWGLELTTPRLVKHQGKLVAFARQSRTAAASLFFQVLDPLASLNTSDDAAWNGWYRFDFPEAPLPVAQNQNEAGEVPGPELRLAGMDLLTVTAAAQTVQPADAPFQVFSDERYLYCLRPSVSGTLYLVRLMLLTRREGQFDREVTRYSLEVAWEVRYQRSGLRDVPASATDTQSPFDLTGRPFYEPTIELPNIAGITNGAYCVARVPTADASVVVWYVAANTAGAVRLFAFAQTSASLTDFTESARTFTPITPRLSDGSALTVLPCLAPALEFYAEQDAANTSAGEAVEMQNIGRLMLAIPVSVPGLPEAAAIYDFSIGSDGFIPDLTSDRQALTLVDGTLADAKFVPDTTSPSFPTASQAAATVQVINGLAVNSMLLGQIQPAASPLLWTGDDGLVHLYYGGPPATEDAAITGWSGLLPTVPQALVAQFDPRVSRVVIELPWRDAIASEQRGGCVQFTARQSGSVMQGAGIAVSDVTFGTGSMAQPQPDLCQVTITYPAQTGLPCETWTGVPRDVSQFVPILNGRASDDTADPEVLCGQRPFFDFSGELAVVRIPAALLAPGETARPGSGTFPAVVTFASTRASLPLAGVTVTRNATGNNDFAFAVKSPSGSLDLIWPDLPCGMDAYDNIFAGAADSCIYDYAPGCGSTPIFGLSTDAYQIQAPLLFYPIGAASNVADMTIEVVAADGLLDVTFHSACGPISLDKVPADVSQFVDALQRDGGFQSLGLAISAEGVAGKVLPTSAPVGALDLRGSACLFDLVLPPTGIAGQTPAPGSYTAGFLGHSFDPAGDYKPTETLGFFVTATMPDSGAPAYVVNQAAPAARVRSNRRLANRAAAEVPQSGAWLRQSPHNACAFNGANSVSIPVVTGQGVTTQRANLRPQWDWTLEAWLQPSGSNPQRLITFRDTISEVAPQAPQLDYRVALEGEDVVQFQSYAKQQGQPDSSYFQTGTSTASGFLLSGSFTWEFWVQPQAVAGPIGSDLPVPLGGVIQVSVPRQANPAFSIGLTADRHVVVRTSSDGSATVDYSSAIVLPDRNGDGLPDWSHVAVAAEQDSPNGGWTLQLYINGVLDSSELENVQLQQDNASALLIIGANTPDNASVYGKVMQVRLWSTTRTMGEIRRTAFMSLAGTEAGLLGCWPMTSLQTGGPTGNYVQNIASVTAADWDANQYLFSYQPMSLVQDNVFLSLVASVGGLAAVEAHAMLATDRWNHIGIAFQAGGALNLNPAARFNADIFDWMRCKSSDELNPSSELAIDAWINIALPTQVEGALCARWAWDQAPQNQSFKFSVDGSGNLALAVVLVDTDAGATKIDSVTSSGVSLADGITRHVAATFEGVAATNGQGGQGSYTMSLYVDGMAVGVKQGTVQTAAVQLQTAQNDFLVGRAGDAPVGSGPDAVENMSLFRGVLGRLRFWNACPSLPELFPERFPYLRDFRSPRGLVAQWEFREQQGSIVGDSIGSNDGVLTSSAPWSSLRETSRLAFYANSAQVSSVVPYDGTLAEAQTSQFNIGVPAEAGITGFNGDVALVSLWDAARSLETVQDQQFVPLVGDENGLLACWDFANGGTDITGGQNNADPPLDPSRLAPCMVPITNEGPFVRNIYGGVVTDLSQSVAEYLGVGAYVDARQDGSRAPSQSVTEIVGAGVNGEARQSGSQAPAAVLKRQFVLDANESFTRGVQIGLLDLTYVGQVQSKPTLIGYIEGAPPVPSENLTRPYFVDPGGAFYMKYLDTSTVTLTQQLGQQLAYSSRTTKAGSLDFSAGLGLVGLNHVTELSAIPWNVEYYDLKGVIQGVAKFQGKWGTEDGNELSAEWTQTQKERMGFSGDWEGFQTDPGNYLNPVVGRRFTPDNLGYALVESLSADLYAAVFHATGAALGTIILPNLGIPPDRNLLLFPMKSGYIKAGTLDGKVGLVNDPDYADADVQRGSYFKPSEAYALAAMVERQNQQALAYGTQFDAPGRGKGGNADLTEAREDLPVDFEDEPAGDAQIARPRSAIANRYVWTADGGLHAEEQGYASVATRSYGGFQELSGGGGVQSEGEFFLLSRGFAWSLDLTAQYGIDVHVGLSQQTQQSVGLDVSVDGEAYLRAWDASAKPEYPSALGAFLPGPAPGKVRAYRFMSFYLPPSTENSAAFSSIVDPVWRTLSNDATARAMRELNANNPVWRVLHRVTYVERVPPAVSSRPIYTQPRGDREPVNLAGNIELLRLIAAHINPAQPLSPINLGNACAIVLNPAPSAPGVYPVSILETRVPWWRAFLDSARPTASGPAPNQVCAALLNRIMLTVVDYVIAGYATDTIPALVDEVATSCAASLARAA